MDKDFSIYIHFPYAKSEPRKMGKPSSHISLSAYVDALLAELYLRSQEPTWGERKVKEIVFCGNSSWTDSYKNFVGIIDSVSKWFKLRPQSDISIRLDPLPFNPKVISRLNLYGLKSVLLGIGSFDSKLTKLLAFQHNPLQGKRIVRVLSSLSNIEAFGIEIFYGAINQSLPSFREDLKQMIRSNAAVILCKEFPLLQMAKKIKYRLNNFRDYYIASSVELEKRRKILWDVLDCAGYEERFIGKFYKDDNDSYSMGTLPSSEYLGIGAGAQSRCTSFTGKQIRYTNISSLKHYYRKILKDGHAELFREDLSSLSLYHEFLDLHLKSVDGLFLEHVQDNFGFALEAAHPGLVKVLEETGHLCRSENTIYLSDKGSVVADNVIENFSLSEFEFKRLREANRYSKQSFPVKIFSKILNVGNFS